MVRFTLKRHTLYLSFINEKWVCRMVEAVAGSVLDDIAYNLVVLIVCYQSIEHNRLIRCINIVQNWRERIPPRVTPAPIPAILEKNRSVRYC